MEWLTPIIEAITAKNMVIGVLLAIIGMQTKILMVFVTRFFSQQDLMMAEMVRADRKIEEVEKATGNTKSQP